MLMQLFFFKELLRFVTGLTPINLRTKNIINQAQILLMFIYGRQISYLSIYLKYSFEYQINYYSLA